MSSIEPYEEGETQLFIANSIEVRSDEICAESVLSADDLVRVSKAAKLDAVSGSRSMHTVVCSQKDCSTAANTIQFRRHSHNTRHGSNYKSNCAASSSNAAGFLHKSQPTSCHSDAEDRASNKHTGSVQKRAYLHSDSVVSNSGGFPPKQNDILKSSSQVRFQYWYWNVFFRLFLLGYMDGKCCFSRCTRVADLICCCTCFEPMQAASMSLATYGTI